MPDSGAVYSSHNAVRYGRRIKIGHLLLRIHSEFSTSGIPTAWQQYFKLLFEEKEQKIRFLSTTLCIDTIRLQHILSRASNYECTFRVFVSPYSMQPLTITRAKISKLRKHWIEFCRVNFVRSPQIYWFIISSTIILSFWISWSS